MCAPPDVLSGTAPVVATTVPPLPPQTRLALTWLTGPGLPVEGRINPCTARLRCPPPFNVTCAFDTAQGRPPLGTPPIDWPGLEPISVDSTPPSSSAIAAPAVRNPATSTAGTILKTIRVS